MQAAQLHSRLEAAANSLLTGRLKESLNGQEWTLRRSMQGDMAVVNIDFKNPDFTANFGVGLDEADQLDGVDEDGVCPLDEVIALRIEDAVAGYAEHTTA